MSLTDYYMFRRLAGTKAKTKFACIGSTKSYQPLEALRAKKKFKGSATMDAIEIGDLFAYISKGGEIVKEKKISKLVIEEFDIVPIVLDITNSIKNINTR